MSAKPEALQPAVPGLAPELREVPGPSPTAGGYRRFLTLLWVMAVTEFKLTFHGTSLGYAWSLLRPLLLFGVLLAVFTQIFRFGDSVPDYPALLLLNIMLFTLFADATQRAVTSVVAREQIVRKAQFPRLVIPLSIVLTEILDLAISMVAVFIFILAYGVDPQWTWLLLPVIVAGLLVVTVAVCTIVSALYPRFRDVLLIWTVLSTVLFYATPVFYPIDAPGAPERFRHILQLNPLTPVFEQAQKWIIDPSAPGALGATKGSEWLLAVSFGVLVALCAAAFWIFRREAPRIAEEL
jgi:ABC-2 type transport system permease protein